MNDIIFLSSNFLQLEPKVENLHRRLFQKYGTPLYGRNRIVYTGKKYVWKVPRNPVGSVDNAREEQIFISTQDKRFARCKQLFVTWNLQVKSQPQHEWEWMVDVLLMEKLVLLPGDTKKKPQWSEYIDDRQVGRDKNGNWKAYDFPECRSLP